MSASIPRFHRLIVNDLRREASDAVSLTFAIPPELAGDYAFAPGSQTVHRSRAKQHLALTRRRSEILVFAPQTDTP